MTTEDAIIEKLRGLTDAKQRQVLEFVETLIAQRNLGQQSPLQQEWAGALIDLRDKFTSLALQKKASEWRDN